MFSFMIIFEGHKFFVNWIKFLKSNGMAAVGNLTLNIFSAITFRLPFQHISLKNLKSQKTKTIIKSNQSSKFFQYFFIKSMEVLSEI